MIKQAGWFLLIIVSQLFLSCANQVAPQGGDKDTLRPKVLRSDPQNFSTGFHSEKIEITFDEYIQLKDLNSQLIVSPPLARIPQTKIRQKTLILLLDDTLQPRTTYTFNFGNSIADNNEGNTLENFQYVFSTGDILDTLAISGKVENAWDKKTEKGILVMLYKNQDDSFPLKKRPDYFSKTNEKGEFAITNIAPGVYRIFVLKESNADYLYNLPDEGIAFSDTPVAAGLKNIFLRMFTEKPKAGLLKSFSEEPGKAVVIFTQPVPDLHYRFISDSLKADLAFVEQSKKKDTVTFWYKNLNLDSIVVLFSNSNSFRDTVSIRLFKADGKIFSRKKNILTISPNFRSGEALDLNKNILLFFNHPVMKSDFSKISLLEDSVPVKDFPITFTDTLKKNISILHRLKEKSTYRLFIPPGTFTDIFGLSNDTLIVSFKVRQLTDYGTLALKIKAAAQQVILLIDEQEHIYRTTSIHGDTLLNYDFLEPKVYRLKAVEDINQNSEWDTGNYFQKIQPERVAYYPESITIRANWDVDVSWKPDFGK